LESFQAIAKSNQKIQKESDLQRSFDKKALD